MRQVKIIINIKQSTYNIISFNIYNNSKTKIIMII